MFVCVGGVGYGCVFVRALVRLCACLRVCVCVCVCVCERPVLSAKRSELQLIRLEVPALRIRSVPWLNTDYFFVFFTHPALQITSTLDKLKQFWCPEALDVVRLGLYILLHGPTRETALVTTKAL